MTNYIDIYKLIKTANLHTLSTTKGNVSKTTKNSVVDRVLTLSSSSKSTCDNPF